MPTQEHNLSIIRKIEQTVLDQHYRRFPLISRNDEVAIPALLKVFGDLVRAMIHDQNLGTEKHKANLMDQRAAALGHCFRWIALEPIHTLQPALSSPQVIAQEAIDLLELGVRYHELYLDHVALTRGEKLAEIDQDTKTIKIHYKKPFDPFFLLAQRMDETDLTSLYYAPMPLEKLMAEWRSSSVQDKSGLQRRSDGLPSIGPGDQAYQTAFRWSTDLIWRELAPETSLNGFQLDDFSRVFAGLVVNCAFLAWTEDHEDQVRGPNRRRGTRIIGLSHERMVKWLQEISGVEAEASQGILTELTLDTTRSLPSLAYQPFVKSKGGRTYLLPRSIFYSDAPRTLSQSLNTGNRRRIFESLGQQMTDVQQSGIATAFTNRGLDVLLDKPLRYGSKEIRPDLVIYDRACDYLLIADYKNMINPLGPGQAISQMINIRSYVKRIQEYLDVVQANLDIVRDRIPGLSENPTVSGLLLFRDPTPLPLDRDTRVVMANWFSLQRFLSGVEYENLPRLIEWATDRPDLAIGQDSYKLEDSRILVGAWQYVREKMIRESPQAKPESS